MYLNLWDQSFLQGLQNKFSFHSICILRNKLTLNQYDIFFLNKYLYIFYVKTYRNSQPKLVILFKNISHKCISQSLAPYFLYVICV